MTEHDEQWDADVQALLKEVTANEGPPEDAKSRILERVEASLTQAPAGSEATATTATTSKALSSWTALGIAAVGVVTIVSLSENDEEPARIERTPSAVSQQVVEAPRENIESLTELDKKDDAVVPLGSKESQPTKAKASEPIVPAALKSSVPLAEDVDKGPNRPTTQTQPKGAPTKPRADLRAEEALLEQARAAINSGRVHRAWKHLRKHAKRFPKGVLVEEREGLWVRGLIRAGRKQRAARRAERFLKRFPRSSQRPMVEKALID